MFSDSKSCLYRPPFQHSNYRTITLGTATKAESGRRSSCGADAVEARDRNTCGGFYRAWLRFGQDLVADVLIQVCLWHGTGRMKAEELKKYDVVSTYSCRLQIGANIPSSRCRRCSCLMAPWKLPSVNKLKASGETMCSSPKRVRCMPSSGTGGCS